MKSGPIEPIDNLITMHEALYLLYLPARHYFQF